MATHSTSLYDEQGNRRADFGLREVFGVSYKEAFNFNTTFLQLEAGSAIGMGLPAGSPLSLATPQWRVEALAGTETAATEIAATVVLPLVDYGIAPRRITWGDPPPEKPTGHPAVTTRQHGKGRVVYIAGLPERAYFQRHYIHCRQLLLNAVRWAAATGRPLHWMARRSEVDRLSTAGCRARGRTRAQEKRRLKAGRAYRQFAGGTRPRYQAWARSKGRGS